MNYDNDNDNDDNDDESNNDQEIHIKKVIESNQNMISRVDLNLNKVVMMKEEISGIRESEINNKKRERFKEVGREMEKDEEEEMKIK